LKNAKLPTHLGEKVKLLARLVLSIVWQVSMMGVGWLAQVNWRKVSDLVKELLAISIGIVKLWIAWNSKG
jgi:hypothetical protein